MRPLLSLGIPTFNRAAYLDRLLSSLVEEAEPLGAEDFELVIRDNASTDDTAAVCERYGQRIRGLRYLRAPENEGTLKNGEAVFRAMEGQWLWLSGDDDFFHPGLLTKLLDEIRKDKCDIILLNRAQCDRDESTIISEQVIEGIGDCYFERLGGFSGVPCSYEMVGFLGSSVYKRDFLDVQAQNIFNLPSYFNHVSIIFATFGNRPAKFFAKPMMTQRLFNIRGGDVLETTIDVSLKTGISLLKELLMVQERGGMPSDELWAWSVRRAYGKGGGAMPLLEWVMNYLIKGPLIKNFGVISDEDYDLMFKFVTGEGRGLPTGAYQSLYNSFVAVVDGLKARQALIQA